MFLKPIPCFLSDVAVILVFLETRLHVQKAGETQRQKQEKGGVKWSRKGKKFQFQRTLIRRFSAAYLYELVSLADSFLQLLLFVLQD